MKDYCSNNRPVTLNKAISTIIVILMLITAILPVFSIHGSADSSDQITYFGTALVGKNV